MFESVQGLWNAITNWFSERIYDVVDMLPDSPFQQLSVPPEVAAMLGYINWILPVGAIITTLSAWVVCMGIYYLASAIMRIFKVVN